MRMLVYLRIVVWILYREKGDEAKLTLVFLFAISSQTCSNDSYHAELSSFGVRMLCCALPLFGYRTPSSSGESQMSDSINLKEIYMTSVDSQGHVWTSVLMGDMPGFVTSSPSHSGGG